MKLREWLKLFRAHTSPALWCLILTPYLHNAELFTLNTAALWVLAELVHHISWGQNSLMDFTQGYDKKDPAKKHHPLLTGALGVTESVNMIYWGLALLMTAAIVLTFYVSPAPALAMAMLTMWMAWGWGYNCGLSKESILGGASITLSFTGMAAWGWYLSHGDLGRLGLISVGYVFMQGVYMNGWTNQMKDFKQLERSHLPHLLGARVHPDGYFRPHGSWWFPVGSKALNLYLLYLMIPNTADYFTLMPSDEGSTRTSWS